jgi:hypothetical protein
MPEDFSAKRRELAGLVVDRVTALIDAMRDLSGAADDLTECGGTFEDRDFQVTPLQHISTPKINVLLKEVVPALAAAADEMVGGADGATAGMTRRAVLLAVKRAG